MRILGRYILAQFLRMTLLCQAGAITLFLIVEFVERIDDFIEKKAALIDGVLYFLYKLPQLVFLSVPLTVLLASTLTLVLFSRGNEIVAMRANGMSLSRIIAPILAACLGISVLTFLANEFVVPLANKRVEYIWRVNIKKVGLQTHIQRDKMWYRSAENTIWQITRYDPSAKKMSGVTLYRLDAANRLLQRIDASEAAWAPGSERWVFRQVVIHHLMEGGRIRQESFRHKTFDFPERPENFRKAGADPETMNYQEIVRYIQELKKGGVDPTRYVVDMWGKLSTPFISFVLALMSVPFSVRSGRSGGAALGVAIAMGIGAIYLVLFYMSLSLGHAGRLPPILAAWGPNALFLTGGAYLIVSMRG